MERHEAVTKAIEGIQVSFPNTGLFVLLDSSQKEDGWELRLGYLVYWSEEALQAWGKDESLAGRPCEYRVGECFVSESRFDEFMLNYDPDQHPWW